MQAHSRSGISSLRSSAASRAPAPFSGTRPRPSRTASVAAHALKLYTNPASRGRIVEWYIKELGVDAELVNMDMKEKRQHKSDWFLKVNPFGKIPALEDGDLKLWESGALLLYIADKYDSRCSTPEARARAAQYVLFANSTLANAIFVEQYRERAMPDTLGVLDKVLGEQPYLGEGGEFGVADVAVGAYLLYGPAFIKDLDWSPYPNVLQYMQRISSRPACVATVASRAQERAKDPQPVKTA